MTWELPWGYRDSQSSLRNSTGDAVAALPSACKPDGIVNFWVRFESDHISSRHPLKTVQCSQSARGTLQGLMTPTPRSQKLSKIDSANDHISFSASQQKRKLSLQHNGTGKHQPSSKSPDLYKDSNFCSKKCGPTMAAFMISCIKPSRWCRSSDRPRSSRGEVRKAPFCPSWSILMMISFGEAQWLPFTLLPWLSITCAWGLLVASSYEWDTRVAEFAATCANVVQFVHQIVRITSACRRYKRKATDSNGLPHVRCGRGNTSEAQVLKTPSQHFLRANSVAQYSVESLSTSLSPSSAASPPSVL